MNSKIRISSSDLHPHIEARMRQRGVTIDEIETTISLGWDADDAKVGTIGKVFVFPYNEDWEGGLFEEKEVTVYYKYRDEKLILLTTKARYGRRFRKGENDENRIRS